MSKAYHQIEIRGRDATAGAFASIGNRAAAAGARLRSVMGGALAAAGAYLGFRAIKGGIDELGHLSDIAQKTGTSVNELTAAATALNALGIQNMGVDQIGKAFDYMAKTTGRSGMQGFYETIGELGKIPDIAKRGQEAMRIFGRSGMEFMPLINAAETGTGALQTLINAMPAIPQSAADAGDAASDAMNIAAQGVKSVWLQAIGAICGWFDGQYQGGIREAAARSAAWLEYYAKVGVSKAMNWWEKTTTFFEGIGTAIGAFIGSEGSFSERWQAAKSAMESEFELRGEYFAMEDAAMEQRIDSWTANYRKRVEEISQLQESYDRAAIKAGGEIKKNVDATVTAVRQIRNDLILGGSNQATKLQLLGPNLQTETKKQTQLLEQIASNTSKTAENTEEGGETTTPTDL